MPSPLAARAEAKPEKEWLAALERLTSPEIFDEGLAFRETFLTRLTGEGQADAFRRVGRAITEHLAEFVRYLPPEPEVFPLSDLRAAAADLRYLQGYLAGIGRSRFEDSGLDARQLELCRLAGETAFELAPLLARIEAALAPEQAG